jgi:MFS family permease
MANVPSKESGLPIGITYAVAFAIYGIFFPFIPLIVRAKGLSDAEAGVALSATGLAAMVGPLFFAHIADRKLQFRYLMPLLLLLGALVVGLLDISHTVPTAFAVTFLLYLFIIPAVSLLDSFTMDFVIRGQRAGRNRSFQDYRIWGSIGFMVPSVALALWFSALAALRGKKFRNVTFLTSTGPKERYLAGEPAEGLIQHVHKINRFERIRYRK